MNVLELTVAVALLAAPPETVQWHDPFAAHEALAPAIKWVALQVELLDPREEDYFKHAENFASDVQLLQGRFAEFQSAPKAAEVNFFPGAELVNDMLAFNESFRKSVGKRLELDMIHADELRDVLAETDQLRRVYDTLRDARCEHFYVTYRRQALALLRDQIGLEAFYSGRLPPHVPLWRIPEER